jgi:alanine racemase
MITKPNNLTIDLSALVYNLARVRSLIGQDIKIMGIVKSDAYGHGLLPVAQTLERNGIDCIGVAYLHEALEIRDEGISSPIVILCGIRTKEEAREVVDKDLTPVLFDMGVAEILARESEKQGKRTRIQVKVDTGMGRLGISQGEIVSFVSKIAALRGLDLEALTSHLSSADEYPGGFTEYQTETFKKAVETARSSGLPLPSNNLANSAGIMGHKQAHFDMVRPGIILYGGLPSPEFKSPFELRPAMRFQGRVLQIREFPHRTPISYGRTYYTEGPRRIAVLSAGYGDGLPRSMSNRGNVLIKGRKAPIVGRICMNLTMCDITGIKDIGPGDEAVFLGSQGDEIITGDDLARWAGTISYEVFCSIGRAHRKEYIS